MTVEKQIRLLTYKHDSQHVHLRENIVLDRIVIHLANIWLKYFV